MTTMFFSKIRPLLPILLNCKHQIASKYTNRIVLMNYWVIILQNMLHHYPMNDRLQSFISYLNEALLKFGFQIIQVQPFELLNIPLVWYHKILSSVFWLGSHLWPAKWSSSRDRGPQPTEPGQGRNGATGPSLEPNRPEQHNWQGPLLCRESLPSVPVKHFNPFHTAVFKRWNLVCKEILSFIPTNNCLLALQGQSGPRSSFQHLALSFFPTVLNWPRLTMRDQDQS